MKNFSFLFVLLLFGCNVDDVININIQDSGITTPSGNFELIIEQGDQPGGYSVDGSDIILDNPEQITKIIADGYLVFDLPKLFRTVPNLRYLWAKNMTRSIGELKELPVSMQFFDVGEGNVRGEITLHERLETFRMNQGNQSKLDVEKLPSTLVNLCVNESKMYGEINENFPQGMKRFVSLVGNTIHGDYGKIQGLFPATFAIKGDNTINKYSNGLVDFSRVAMQQFLHYGNIGYGLSSNDVDNLLIDLSKSTWTKMKKLEIYGYHQPRTSKSDLAVQSLQSQGVDVFTNE